MSGTRVYFEHDTDAGVWRWKFTAWDKIPREGEADTYAAADLAARMAHPKPPDKMITPPGYALRNRGGGGVAGSF